MHVRIALRPPFGAITSHNCAELARNSSEFPGLTYTNEETRRTELASSVAYLLESTIHEGFGVCTQGTRKGEQQRGVLPQWKGMATHTIST